MAEPLTKAQVADERPISHREAQRLREQIRKWQERLPQLAAAVRTRAEALAAARREIRALKQAAAEPDGSAVRRELDALRSDSQRELESLRVRNAHLFDALQIANTQLARMTDTVRSLHHTLDAKNRQLDALQHDDGLTRVRGIGGKLAEQLRESGICTLSDLAALDDDALDDEAHALHALRGRIRRDQWVEQARKLA